MLKSLFPFERPLTSGRMLHYRLIELFLVGYTIHYVWKWSFYAPRLSEVVLPLGLANYMDVSVFYGGSFMTLVAILTTISLIVAFFTTFRASGYTIGMILFHMQYVIRFTQGEIPHSMNMIGMGILALSMAAWTFRQDWQKQMIFGFGLIVFFFGLGYFTAAISKLIATGPSWVYGEHLQLWIYEKGVDSLSKFGTWSPNWLQELALQSTAIATVILSFGLLNEALGPMFWSEKLRPYIAIMAVGMHFGIYLSMGIRFDAYLIQIILIGLPWHVLLEKLVISTSMAGVFGMKHCKA